MQTKFFKEMNITQNSKEALTAMLTVTIEKSDYADKVDKALNNYRKNATIKGFRKGQVPMSFVKKQYEQSAIYDEVNQLLQTGINDYIQKEKIAILGNPLPKVNEKMDWNADELVFEFEVGLAPEFDVDLKKLSVEAYKVNVGDDEVQKYVDNFAERFGSMKSLDAVTEGKVNIKVQIKELNTEEGIDKESFLFTEELANAKDFIGKKIGDVVVVNAQKLYEDPMSLESTLGLTAEEVADFNGDLEITIKEITVMEPSAIDQSLFDKVYGENAVADEAAFRQKIKEEAEKMYAKETDKQMMNDGVDQLIKDTQFDLPNEFLARWLLSTNDKFDSIEAAEEQLKKEETGLRYQLIESKIAEKYDLKVEFADVEAAMKNIILEQLKMYGQTEMPEEDLQRIVQSSLQNQQEFQRMADQVFADKLTQTFKENAKINVKEVTFDAFIEIMEEKHKALHQAQG